MARWERWLWLLVLIGPVALTVAVAAMVAFLAFFSAITGAE